jgi:hypothetical protein
MSGETGWWETRVPEMKNDASHCICSLNWPLAHCVLCTLAGPENTAGRFTSVLTLKSHHCASYRVIHDLSSNPRLLNVNETWLWKVSLMVLSWISVLSYNLCLHYAIWYPSTLCPFLGACGPCASLWPFKENPDSAGEGQGFVRLSPGQVLTSEAIPGTGHMGTRGLTMNQI